MCETNVQSANNKSDASHSGTSNHGIIKHLDNCMNVHVLLIKKTISVFTTYLPKMG